MKFTVWLNGKELPVQKARVSAFPLNRVWPGKQRDMDQTEWTEFVSFDLDCEGKGELEIRSDEGKMESVEIRPLAQEIPMERGISKMSPRGLVPVFGYGPWKIWQN